MIKFSEIVDHLHLQIVKALGFDFPAYRWLEYDWSSNSAEDVEKFSKRYSAQGVNDLLAWETKSVAQSRNDWLTVMGNVACKSAASLRSSSPTDIQKRTNISQYKPASLPADGDTVLIKVNHGFWEQLFLIINESYDPVIMRPTSKLGYRKTYLDSRFLDAFVSLSRQHVQMNNNSLQFGQIKFGFSYNSGDFWNHELSEKVINENVQMLKVMRGSAAGLEIFLSNFFEYSTVNLVDGAYAKQGLFDGTLAQLLEDISIKSDHAFFVVPGHLSSLHFKSMNPKCQTILHVSQRLVHEAWPLALAGIGNPILQRVASGEHVAVIVQAAVFSAMLAEYLLTAKKNLQLTGRISFIDLGQALDVLTPETGSIWIKRVSQKLDVDISQLPLSI